MPSIAESTVPQEVLEACTARCGRVRDALANAGLEAVLITAPVDVVWLTGTHGHDCHVLLMADTAVLLSDRRYEEYLAPWDATDQFCVDLSPRPEQSDRIKALLHEAGVTSVGIQAEVVTLSQRTALDAALAPVETKELTRLVANLRQCKDDLEVTACVNAIDIQHAALEATLEAMQPGWTEARFAARLIEQMRLRGAQCEAFEPIIGSGANSSVIHHVPSDQVIEPGVLLVDWGARVDSRNSDLTRTLFLGDAPEPLVALFGIVKAAHDAAVEACSPGVDAAAIDGAARAVIEAAGHGDHFPHGVGHGLGLDVHEQPFLGRKGAGATLQSGMIVTIEPGIYLPGVGGVRIENDVLITDSGHTVLSAHVPCDLAWSTRAFPK
jgi:Xaa-Pro aminopeptidase